MEVGIGGLYYFYLKWSVLPILILTSLVYMSAYLLGGYATRDWRVHAWATFFFLLTTYIVCMWVLL